jgi:hypothetical protein
MKRFSFITALLGVGVAKAQQAVASSGYFERVVETPPDPAAGIFGWARLGRQRKKPANGECPVCGTMAEAFNPVKETASTFRCIPQGDGNSADCRWRDTDVTPTSRTVTCAHCRVHFEQEAEK